MKIIMSLPILPFGVGSGLTLPLLLGQAWPLPFLSFWLGPWPFHSLLFWLGLAFSSFGSGPGQARPEGQTPTPRRKGQPQPKGPTPTRRANPDPEKGQPPPKRKKGQPQTRKRKGQPQVQAREGPNPHPEKEVQPRPKRRKGQTTQGKEGPIPFPRVGRAYSSIFFK